MKINNLSDRFLYNISSKDIEEGLKETNNRHNNICRLHDELNPKKDYGQLKNIILEFASIFKKNFSEEQTKSMLFRLNRLEVKEKEEKVKRRQKDVRLGSYNAYYNRMTLYKYDDEQVPKINKKVIFHELLHMASSRNTGENNLSGFETSVIGKELNEGYTEYLRMKYFSNEKYTESDDWRITVVKGLEYLVGEKQMANFYFNADLPGLIRELERYSSKESVMKLLFLIDRVEAKDFSIKKYKQVIDEIARMNKNKLDHYFNRGVITPMQYDMMSALKVEELKRSVIWSEKSKFSSDGKNFIIIDTDSNKNSPLYELKSKSKKTSQIMQI